MTRPPSSHFCERSSALNIMARFTCAQILEYRASIIPIRQKSQEEIDKQVLTISSATLGLSLTFYKDVLSKQIVVDGWLLLLAWICWMIAIGSVVFSMSLSSEAGAVFGILSDVFVAFFAGWLIAVFSCEDRFRCRSENPVNSPV